MGCNPANATPVGSQPNGIQCGPCGEDGLPLAIIEGALDSTGSIAVDGMSIGGTSVDDVIKLDQYLINRKNRCSGGGGWLALGKVKAIPPNVASGE